MLEAVVENEGAGAATLERHPSCLVAALPHHDGHAGKALGKEHRLVTALPRSELDAVRVRHDLDPSRLPSIAATQQRGLPAQLGDDPGDHLGERRLAAASQREVAHRDDGAWQAPRPEYARRVQARADGETAPVEPGEGLKACRSRPADLIAPGAAEPGLAHPHGLSHDRHPSGTARRARACA